MAHTSNIVERFITDVVRIVAEDTDRAMTIEKIQPLFAELLADKTFLAEEHRCVVPNKFAQYAIYRAPERSLSLMSMVVPPGETTPVHDHLAWGLVGVYQGVQRETIYRRLDDGAKPRFAELEQVGERVLKPGDITTLLPPDGDIHQIETISDEPSISIHLLGNDIGCELRHAYHPHRNVVVPFRSGYQNVPCLQAHFDHQHLIVENVEETVAFYESIMGAEQIGVLEVHGKQVVSMDLNGTRLVISRQVFPGVGSHYALDVDDLDAAVDELKSRDVEFLTEPDEVFGVKFVYIKDVAGNTIELLQRGAPQLGSREV
jgi:3-mercaptopropionate dioxygenase